MNDAHAIGVDVGGTSIKSVVARRADGRILDELRVGTPADPTGRAVAESVAKLVVRLPGADTLPIGVVVPGIVDESRGLAVHSANLGWRGIPLAAMVDDALGRPVGFGHDVRAGALAEARWGAARSEGGVVAFVAVGTGISAALLVDGRPLSADGWAGETGQRLIPYGPHAGHRVESVASAAATARRAGESGARRVAERVAAGDPVAVEVWHETVSLLADMLADIAMVAGPRTIVVGGGLSQAGEVLLGPLRTAVSSRLGDLRIPDLRVAALGDRAAALGAALLASDAS